MYAACENGAQVIEVQNAVLQQWEAERADRGAAELDLPVAAGEAEDEDEGGEDEPHAAEKAAEFSSDDDEQGGSAAGSR